MKKYILRIIFLILIILNSTVIFGFSAQNGEKSGSLSKSIIIKIADILNINAENKEHFIKNGEIIIRKIAHFSIYTSLGIWSMGFISTFEIKKKTQIIITFIWGVIYASTDEIHQLFIRDRNGSVSDVILDSFGVIFGIIIVMFVMFIISKIKLKINKERLEN